VFLQEPMQWNLLAGLTLVTCGILFGVRQAAQPAQPVESAAPAKVVTQGSAA
jgi:hypothetical protein